MNYDTAKALGDGAAALAVSTGASSYLGWFDFINQYASGIGVIISFLAFVSAVVFYIMTYNKPDNSSENAAKIMELQSELDDAIERIHSISERKNKK